MIIYFIRKNDMLADINKSVDETILSSNINQKKTVVLITPYYGYYFKVDIAFCSLYAF